MAMSNRKSFENLLSQKNLNAQIILGNSKKQDNVNAIIVSGYKFDRLSLFTKVEIELLLDDIICNGVQKAYEHHTYKRSSAAKQKINVAHGRTDMEIQNNQDVQDMTYADVLENIQHVGRTWTEVLYQVFVRDTSPLVRLDKWVECLQHFHGKNYKNVIKEIANKTVYLINNHVYCDYAFRENLKKCAEVNGYEFSEETMTNMIKMFVQKAAAVV